MTPEQYLHIYMTLLDRLNDPEFQYVLFIIEEELAKTEAIKHTYMKNSLDLTEEKFNDWRKGLDKTMGGLSMLQIIRNNYFTEKGLNGKIQYYKNKIEKQSPREENE